VRSAARFAEMAPRLAANELAPAPSWTSQSRRRVLSLYQLTAAGPRGDSPRTAHQRGWLAMPKHSPLTSGPADFRGEVFFYNVVLGVAGVQEHLKVSGR
jgi:hypothetical protein